MPSYTYRCEDCEMVTTIEKSMWEPHPETCCCGGCLNRIYYPAKVHFKGGGFYTNDKVLDHHTPGDYEHPSYLGDDIARKGENPYLED